MEHFPGWNKQATGQQLEDSSLTIQIVDQCEVKQRETRLLAQKSELDWCRLTLDKGRNLAKSRWKTVSMKDLVPHHMAWELSHPLLFRRVQQKLDRHHESVKQATPAFTPQDNFVNPYQLPIG